MWVSKTIMFAGTCLARAEATLASQRIMRPFRTREITARFAAGCADLLALRLYLSTDETAPTTGRPTGVSLLQDYGQVDSVRGDDVQIVLNHVIVEDPGGSWLKVHATNDDWYDHAINVDIEIEVEMEEDT